NELYVIKGDNEEGDGIICLKFIVLKKKDKTKNVSYDLNLCYALKDMFYLTLLFKKKETFSSSGCYNKDWVLYLFGEECLQCYLKQNNGKCPIQQHEPVKTDTQIIELTNDIRQSKSEMNQIITQFKQQTEQCQSAFDICTKHNVNIIYFYNHLSTYALFEELNETKQSEEILKIIISFKTIRWIHEFDKYVIIIKIITKKKENEVLYFLLFILLIVDSTDLLLFKFAIFSKKETREFDIEIFDINKYHNLSNVKD
ncbi:hypothetical protein RFI_18030, partial [Reticulomyxa filosa]